MAKLDVRKNLEMPTCGRWAEGERPERETKRAGKEDRAAMQKPRPLIRLAGLCTVKVLGRIQALKKKNTVLDTYKLFGHLKSVSVSQHRIQNANVKDREIWGGSRRM